MISTVALEPDCCFFFFRGRSSSSSSSARDLGLPLAVPKAAAALAAGFFAAGASSSGSSTTKRYLHFGQSTFLPMKLSSLIVTFASQLGHWTLKDAMQGISAMRGYVPGWEEDRGDLSNRNYHTR